MPNLTALVTKTQTVSILQGEDTVLELHCSVSEKHSRESPPTEFETENGQTISDHIIVKPLELELQGIISDTPISRIGSLLTTAVGRLTPSAAVLGKFAPALALLPVLGTSNSPSADAYLQLLNIQESRQPVRVLTSLKHYNNMWISSISVPREAKTGKILLFTAKFRQLLLVSPDAVNITLFEDPNVAAGRGDKGRKEAGEPNQGEYNRAYNNGHGVFGG
jgi:hypothetical protein